MRNAIISILFPLLLVACATNQTLPVAEHKVVERVEYVVKIPPKELLEIAAPPPNINVDTAAQSIVAQWILANEDYINKLRNQIRAIAKFLKDEQDKADVDAKKTNEAAILKPLAPLKPLEPLVTKK